LSISNHLDPLEPRRLCAGLGADLFYGEEGRAAAQDGEYGDVDRKQLVSVDADGRLVVFRKSFNDASIRRYLSNGTPDPAFERRLPENTRGGAATIARDGRILVGMNVDPTGVGDELVYDVQLLRLRADGSTDTSFGKRGLGRFGIAPPAELGGYAISRPEVLDVSADPSGRVIVLMAVEVEDVSAEFISRNAFFVAARFTASGRLDGSFGDDGFRLLNTGANLPVDPDTIPIDPATGRPSPPTQKGALRHDPKSGRTFALLQGGSITTAIALDKAGRIDRNYGSRGRVRVPGDAATYGHAGNTVIGGINAAVDAAGRLYYSVNARYDNGQLLEPPAGVLLGGLYRLNTDGSLDATWGEAGFSNLESLHGQFVMTYSVDFDGNGRVYVTGDKGVARLTLQGGLDPTFDFDGIVSAAVSDTYFSEPAVLPIDSAHEPDAFFAATNLGSVTRFARQTTGVTPDGTLRVYATSAGQAVRIETHRFSGQIRVQVGDEVRIVDPRRVSRIEVRLSDGDDDLLSTLLLPMTVHAGGGDDLLVAAWHTTWHTGIGDDTVSSGDGDDVVFNDAGHDDLVLRQGNARVYSNGANASASVVASPILGQSASISTGSGSDSVLITSGGHAYVSDTGGALNRINVFSTPDAPAVITTGDSGRTFVQTASGNDTINAGAGRDEVNSGAGDDVITNLAGPGVLYGGEGNDSIRGGAGNDRIDGAEGNDTLRGNAGDDEIRGGPGNDRLFGNEGRDVLIGGDGYDRANADDDDTVSLIELLA